MPCLQFIRCDWFHSSWTTSIDNCYFPSGIRSISNQCIQYAVPSMWPLLAVRRLTFL